ncbi:hypothetical protein [Burkholderia pseudomallei]|uniref:hypothetical protein n=1 Tax=Burkholderia pseudomallei TaxID=28450 RepID=UPI000ACB4641|nr:hypothetical protein [Burkholderia pseudomallei]
MPKNMRRHDHTAWLTHFVRDRNPEQDFPGTDEDEFGHYVGGEIDCDAKAFEVLKTIIRLGGLTPGYSFRKGRTTIYGGQPAVCATEMPLYAFATYARERAEAGNVSAYGIAFLKSEFYAAGGRPAIYGLSTDNVSYIRNTATCRVFDESVLPEREQFRYVAHNPAQLRGRLDWSHEREWRWVPQNSDLDEIWVKDYNDVLGPTPALPIFKGNRNGRPFTRVCVIVWSNDEADEIRELLTGLYLAGANNYDTPFDKKLIERSRIIVLEDVVSAVECGNDIDAQTIEGLAKAQLLQSITITEAPTNANQIIADAFAAADAATVDASAAYDAKHGNHFSGFGFAHVATTDVTNPIVQHLLATGNASGPYDGEVWINVPGTMGSGDLNRAEAVCTAIAKVLSEHLGIFVYVTTRED